MTEANVEDMPSQGRGPAYPFVALPKAVERIESIRDANMARIAVSPLAFYKAWGFGTENGNARQTLAALNQFNLVEYVGRGKDREVKLSNLAHRIIFDKVPDSQERFSAVKEAALAPPIYAKLWDKYGGDLPPDYALETFLTRDQSFSEIAAKNVIGGYRNTFEFARLAEPAIMPPTKPPTALTETETETPSTRFGNAAVGDVIQIEIGGVQQLARAARVRAIQDHEGKKWVFVDGSETGIPMDQVLVQSKAPLEPPSPARRLAIIEASTENTSTRGEREWLRGPLSKETAYRLIVSGDLGPKEIGKLIKLLQAQREVLSDEDEDEPK